MKRLMFAAMLFFFGSKAFAATATTTLQVSAVVPPVCSVATTPVAFPEYQGANVSTTGAVLVTCEAGAAYHVALDAGSHYNTFFRQVSEALTGAMMQYALYDPATGAEWGDSDYANSYTWGPSVAGVGTGVQQTMTINATLLATGPQQYGTYADVVNVTLHF